MKNQKPTETQRDQAVSLSALLGGTNLESDTHNDATELVINLDPESPTLNKDRQKLTNFFLCQDQPKRRVVIKGLTQVQRDEMLHLSELLSFDRGHEELKNGPDFSALEWQQIGSSLVNGKRMVLMQSMPPNAQAHPQPNPKHL